MVEVSEIPEVKFVETQALADYQDEEMKEVYHNSRETLIKFLTKCKGKDVEVCPCLRCNTLFDKAVAKSAEEAALKKFHQRLLAKRMGTRVSVKQRFGSKVPNVQSFTNFSN